MIVATPKWDIPEFVRAKFSFRDGGVSDPPFHSLNLSANVGDDSGAVGENRMRLRDVLPSAPKWLQQAHTVRVVCAEEVESDATVADGAYTFADNVVCAVTTADCLPVLFCADNGAAVAAAHAGWRGLAGGVLENTAAELQTCGKLRAWIGPAICGAHYEIGEEVRNALRRDSSEDEFFTAKENGKWFADLPRLAMHRLQSLGIATTASGVCTYANGDKFFSARRDTRCGRTATLIWKTAAE